jgi:hypothetical protein
MLSLEGESTYGRFLTQRSDISAEKNYHIIGF